MLNTSAKLKTSAVRLRDLRNWRRLPKGWAMKEEHLDSTANQYIPGSPGAVLSVGPEESIGLTSAFYSRRSGGAHLNNDDAANRDTIW
jgi:hypothetical protein